MSAPGLPHAMLPTHTTLPLTPPFSRASLTPMAAATPTVAMRLCPHAWPRPGSASYSELNETARPSPLENSARKAVLMLYAPRVTVKPCSSR